MKIKKFKVKNYKVFENMFEVDFKDEHITILLGINNVGKSTFLESLDMFLKMVAPKEEDFNKNKIGTQEGFEFEMEAIDNENNFVVLKSTYTNKGKSPKYYINGTVMSKQNFNEYLEDKMTIPFYVSPDTKAEDNEKNIQTLFQETAKQMIEEDADKKESFDEIARNIDVFLTEANKVIQPSIDELSGNVKNDLNRIFGEELGNLDIKLHTNNFNLNDYAKLLTSEMQFIKGDNEYKLSTQGTGVRRASFISLLQNAMKEEKLIFKNNHLLLIDEPEVFLHPMAVKELSNILYDIAGEKLQIIISTHSPIFVDLYKGLNTSIRILKIDNGVLQLFASKENDLDQDEIENLKLLTLTNAYFNEFFFAKRVLIVEGDSEYIIFNETIKQYLLNEGKGKLPTHIINAKGKWTISTIQKILNKFQARYYIYHDLDNDKISDDNNLRQANERIKELAEDNPNSHVIANKNTLEVTLYGERYSNSVKTRKAIELIETLKKTEIDEKKEVNIIKNIVKWLYDEEFTLNKEIEVIK